MRTLVACFLGVCAIGCGGTSAPIQVARALPVVEMRYVAGHGPDSVTAISIHADGRIEKPAAPTAHIDGGRIVCPDGVELVRVEGDRIMVDAKLVGRFTNGDGFEIDHHFGSWSVTVLDDGNVSLTTHAEGTMSSSELRWEGFQPAARRAAVLVTALLTPAFGGRWCGVVAATRPQ